MFNIKLLKPEYIEVKKFILRINGAWMDIHRLNYIAKYLVLQLTEDKRRKVGNSHFAVPVSQDRNCFSRK
jgi:hypothetical protein